ncbi:hypothetical protein B0T14DRAFT_526238 [Immersiella caudata]|uniref:Secreted protein n=1 Tax=Immersiella caudata TaxID=314043 RepID=A0AA39WDK8_9PEZI|nr:hypothetical protein B0T14DRAFT_526238 [Immersiella caudata]
MPPEEAFWKLLSLFWQFLPGISAFGQFEAQSSHSSGFLVVRETAVALSVHLPCPSVLQRRPRTNWFEPQLLRPRLPATAWGALPSEPDGIRYAVVTEPYV